MCMGTLCFQPLLPSHAPHPHPSPKVDILLTWPKLLVVYVVFSSFMAGCVSLSYRLNLILSAGNHQGRGYGNNVVQRWCLKLPRHFSLFIRMGVVGLIFTYLRIYVRTEILHTVWSLCLGWRHLWTCGAKEARLSHRNSATDPRSSLKTTSLRLYRHE